QLNKNETVPVASKEAADNYLSNINQIKSICEGNNIYPMFFIQPNPYYHYDNKANDPIVDTSSNALVTYGYQLLEKQYDTTNNMFFLGDMLKQEKQLPFIDQFHYSPYMNHRIAEQIYEKLGRFVKK